MVVRVVLVVALLWFGWQGWVHATSWLSAQSRLERVSEVWQGNQAAREAAGSASGQIASGLQLNAVEDGYNPVQSWTTDRATITVTTFYLTCNRKLPLQLEIRESRDVVTLLVRESPTWVPDRGRLFPPKECTDEAVPVEVTAPLKEPIGKRVVVDAATGLSVGR